MSEVLNEIRRLNNYAQLIHNEHRRQSDIARHFLIPHTLAFPKRQPCSAGIGSSVVDFAVAYSIFTSPHTRKYYFSTREPIYAMKTNNDSEDDIAYSDFLLKKYLNMKLYERFTKQSDVYENFSKNPALTFSTVLDHLHENWAWGSIEKNTSITWDTVQLNRSLREWDIENYSSNPNLTWDIVREFENEPWSFSALSANPSITCDIIEDFPQYNWDFGQMHKNPNLTEDFIKNNIDKPFNFNDLSSHRNITLDLVVENQDRKWNIVDVGNNEAISYENLCSDTQIFKSYPMQYFNFNPNMPWDSFYKINTRFKLNHVHTMIDKNPHFTVENIANECDPHDKLFGKFDFIEYMRNEYARSWELIDYAINRSRDGPVKENPIYDEFLGMCNNDGHVDEFKRSIKMPTALFFEPKYMSNCPETTFTEIEKYKTNRFIITGKWSTSLARNPMPKYKEKFINSTIKDN